MERGAGPHGPRRAIDFGLDRHSARHSGVRRQHSRHRPSRGNHGVRHETSGGVPASAASDRARHRPVMNRLDATRAIVALAGDSAIVASLGHPAYDLFAAGDRPRNFYTWGSMGLASSIGLGLALGRPGLRVFVVDGDGSLLMNLGSLATIGWAAPPYLLLIVWDNEEYATTGAQQTAPARG